jgi:hypothetical protein
VTAGTTQGGGLKVHVIGTALQLSSNAKAAADQRSPRHCIRCGSNRETANVTIAISSRPTSTISDHRQLATIDN